MRTLCALALILLFATTSAVAFRSTPLGDVVARRGLVASRGPALLRTERETMGVHSRSGLSSSVLINQAGTKSSLSLSSTSLTSVKPRLEGLLDEGILPPAGYQSEISGLSVDVTWASLQPTQGGPISSNNKIDQAIATVRAYNAQYGTHLHIKLRVLAGIDAPDWAKNLDGTPVSVTSPQTKVSGTIGRFWTANFAAAYQDLQSKLAALYDSIPEISEVVASQCTTVYAEPFVRDTNDANTVRNLLAAGFTESADQQCIADMFTAHAVWSRTRTGVAFSEYQVINSNGTTGVDLSFTQSMMDNCRAVLGPRCVIENDFLDSSTTASPLILAMAALGPANGFQTAQCSLVGNLTAALQRAVKYGFQSVELCPGYWNLASPTALAAFPAELAAASYVPPPPVSATCCGAMTTANASTVQGTVTPDGVDTWAWFQYGTTTAYGQTTPLQSVGDWAFPVNVSASLSGLRNGITYHFRVVAKNSSGVSYGPDRNFATPWPPSATTKAATNTAAGTFDLTGTLNAMGTDTKYYFEWGVSTTYGHSTPVADAGAGKGPVSVSAVISGVTPGSTYHYQLLAESAAGSAVGGDRTFLAYPPSDYTGSATVPSSGTLSLTGGVDPKGSATSYYFEWGLTSAYGHVTAVASAGSGTSSANVSALISGLVPGTVYHYQLVATNFSGSAAGGDRWVKAQ